MRFIVFGDSKGNENGINKKTLHSILKKTSNLNPKPKFIVMCGDTVAGSKNKETLRSQLSDLKDIINMYHSNIQLVPVIGNHEVNMTFTDDRFEKVFREFYNSFIPDSNSLSGYNKTVYYIDFINIRIIVLNSFHYDEIHKISNAQLTWLEEKAYDNTKVNFLFIHSPLFPTGAHLGHCLDLYPTSRNSLLKVIERCNIPLVICGHEHNYSRRIISNKPIFQIITGGGGEKLRDKYKSKNGVIIPPIPLYHFLIIDVDKFFIKISSMTTKGKILDEFILEKKFEQKSSRKFLN